MNEITYCQKCGLCCKLFRELALPDEITKDLDRGDGVCKYLAKNLCTIYAMRPLVCNSLSLYQMAFSKQLSWDEYQSKLQVKCSELIEKYGGKNERSS